MRLKWVLALLPCLVGPALAGTVTDPVGDWAPSYTGARTADFDVISSFVTYDAAAHLFTVSGTMAGNIVATSGARYVWGFNTGTGTRAPFADAPGVKFNSAVVLNANGTGAIGAIAIETLISGATISASFSDSLLASTGAAPGDYTWNFWPNVGGSVPDFAPDNAMVAVTAVPEPASWALTGLGLLGLLACQRRRR